MSRAANGGRTPRKPRTLRGLAAMLERYLDAVPGRRYPEIREDFSRVVRRAPDALVQCGLRAAFGAKDTPPLPAMVTRLVRHSDAKQRAALIDHLIGRLGTSAATVVAAGTSDGQLIRALLADERAPTSDEAGRVRPDTVQRLVARAARSDPGLVDDMSKRFASHSALAASLDGIALTHAMAAMADQALRAAPKPRSRTTTKR